MLLKDGMITKRLIYQIPHNLLISMSQWLFSMEERSKIMPLRTTAVFPDFLWKKKIAINCWYIILIIADNNSIKCNSNQ